VLDGDIGLTGPSEAGRRTVIGITGRYRPETAKRLAVPCRAQSSRKLDESGAALVDASYQHPAVAEVSRPSDRTHPLTARAERGSFPRAVR
jgi:hypothetical protein